MDKQHEIPALACNIDYNEVQQYVEDPERFVNAAADAIETFRTAMRAGGAELDTLDLYLFFAHGLLVVTLADYYAQAHHQGPNPNHPDVPKSLEFTILAATAIAKKKQDQGEDFTPPVSLLHHTCFDQMAKDVLGCPTSQMMIRIEEFLGNLIELIIEQSMNGNRPVYATTPEYKAELDEATAKFQAEHGARIEETIADGKRVAQAARMRDAINKRFQN